MPMERRKTKRKMKMTMKPNLMRAAALGLGVSALGLMAGTAATADEMVMSSWLPPSHPLVTDVMQPWADEVAQVTDGRVTVRILPSPLGPPPAAFDLAVDGIADITYGLHSFSKDDRFLRSEIGQFSFLGNTAEKTSAAYWNVYSGDLDAQGEHQGAHLLSLWVHGPGMFHNNARKIETPDDFNGLKIRVPGGYIAELVEELGATTQFMGPGEVFEKLSNHVIDGVTFPMEALKSFNLAPHLTHTLKVDGGLYNTSWFLVMNEEKWDQLSEADQAAIQGISGAALAARAGMVWDKADQAGVEAAAAANVAMDDASPEVLAKIQAIAAAKEAAWSEKLNEQGFDGAAALTSIREQAAD